MGQDKMPEMGEHVEVGLAPVKEETYCLTFDWLDEDAEIESEAYQRLTLVQLAEKVVELVKKYPAISLTIEKEEN